MEELALNILDITQNSIRANATRIEIIINESLKDNILEFRISDNGQGMTEELRKKVLDPFTTTRTTRKVGLGLPLLDMVASQCDGKLVIQSELNQGTVVSVSFRHDHIDRPPLGNVKDTLITLIVANPDIEFDFTYRYADRVFHFNSREITDLLGDISLTHPLVYEWLNGFIEERMQDLIGGVTHENS